jgi:tyrosyl-tRNA synthetase
MEKSSAISPDGELARLMGGLASEIPHGGLKEKLDQARAEHRPLRIKYGADPSAPNLHLGHTVNLRKLRQFQDLGHTVDFLIGDFTGMIGDPSGRSTTRPALTKDDVARNARTYEEQVWKILDRKRTRVVFNSEWCSKLGFSDVIRLASQYTVARLLERDDFTKRWKEGTPIGLHEFLYPIVQGYDSVVLESDIEMCGTDQIFNCHVARAMQEAAGQSPEVIIAVPLLEGTDGVVKMSKSQGNAVGITDEPGEMYGKLLSIPDPMTARYASLLLDAPLDPGLGPRDAKHALARALVARYHGEKAAETAAEGFERMFVRGEAPEDAPEHAIPESSLDNGRIWIVRLLLDTTFAPSRNEAHRLVAQGAVELDGVRISDPREVIAVKDGMMLKVGKRRFARLKVSKS